LVVLNVEAVVSGWNGSGDSEASPVVTLCDCNE